MCALVLPEAPGNSFSRFVGCLLHHQWPSFLLHRFMRGLYPSLILFTYLYLYIASLILEFLKYSSICLICSFSYIPFFLPAHLSAFLLALSNSSFLPLVPPCTYFLCSLFVISITPLHSPSNHTSFLCRFYNPSISFTASATVIFNLSQCPSIVCSLIVSTFLFNSSWNFSCISAS